MSGTPFFATIMGRKFFEVDVPRAVRALERLVEQVEVLGARGRIEALEAEVAELRAFKDSVSVVRSEDFMAGGQSWEVLVITQGRRVEEDDPQEAHPTGGGSAIVRGRDGEERD